MFEKVESLQKNVGTRVIAFIYKHVKHDAAVEGWIVSAVCCHIFPFAENTLLSLQMRTATHQMSACH